MGLAELLVRAGWEVVIARIELTCLPFHRVRSRSTRRVRVSEHSPRRIGWAVQVASRFVPRATCLTQAIAAKRLLERNGFECELRLGVARTDDGLIRAHAWIERGEEIVVGGFPAERFTALT
jgi:transglutaminase superfamily protein